jgi:hypothetical protein
MTSLKTKDDLEIDYRKKRRCNDDKRKQRDLKGQIPLLISHMKIDILLTHIINWR